MDSIEEGGIGHRRPNNDIVVVAVIDVNVGVSAKAAISTSQSQSLSWIQFSRVGTGGGRP